MTPKSRVSLLAGSISRPGCAETPSDTRMQSLLRLAAILVLAGCSCTSEANGAAGTSGPTFFLPTGTTPTNTSPPTIQLDASGVLHAVYPSYGGGGAFYMECPAGCRRPEDMRVVKLSTGTTTVLNAMLALDAHGHPQVLLATGQGVHYATCAGDCGQEASWTITQIIQHGGEKAVTGQAFALDPHGRPRFIMHTYIAFGGIGQRTPASEWVQCDENCSSPASWKRGKFSDQIWGHNRLRIDRTGRAHLATVALVNDPSGTIHVAAYATCARDCGTPDAWKSTGFGRAANKYTEAIALEDRAVLALSSADEPRAVFMLDDGGQRKLVYARCTAADCTANGTWAATVLADGPKLQNGFDLALDAADHPRIAYNLDFNIGLLHCEADDCTPTNAPWEVKPIERSSDIPRDSIILYPNCTVAAWFLHDPSLALRSDGSAIVAYAARDISGGVSTTDPSKPPCVAGTDMILGRIAFR